MEGVELSSLSCARWKRALRPVRGVKRWASLRRTNSSSVGGGRLLAAQRSVKRFQRTLTGASTLTKRKNGRRRRASTTASSQMSVVTQRSRQRSVTKSMRASTLAKVCWAPALWVSESSATVRARCRRVKPCSSTRNEAIDDLPAQIPGARQLLPGALAKERLASAQSDEHADSGLWVGDGREYTFSPWSVEVLLMLIVSVLVLVLVLLQGCRRPATAATVTATLTTPTYTSRATSLPDMT
jgi:hypothetical protein